LEIQAKNNPTFAGPHASYSPLEVVMDEDAILKCDNLGSSSDKWYYHPDNAIGDRKV
jgi:hypothetical protein